MIKINKNKFRSLNNEVGEEINDPKELADLIRNHFTSLFTTDKADSPRLVTNFGSTYLTFPPFTREIRRVVFSMGPLKAPGVDGYNPLFFQKHWDEIAHDVMSFVNPRSSLKKSIKHSFVSFPRKIALTPLRSLDQ